MCNVVGIANHYRTSQDFGGYRIGIFQDDIFRINRVIILGAQQHLTSGAVCSPSKRCHILNRQRRSKFCGIFSPIHAFQRSSAPSLGWPYIGSTIFLRRTRMRIVHTQRCDVPFATAVSSPSFTMITSGLESSS